jgi:PAS domain S-box-containing protein
MPRHFRQLCLLLLTFVGSCSIPRHAVAAGSQPPLRLVGDRDYPPITYLESGVAKGVDVDIATAIARRIGRELRIDLMGWDEAQAIVLRGEADGLLAMSITDERRRLYAFTDPTRTQAFGVFVRRGALVIRDASDLSTRRVGVTRGGYPRRFLENQQVGSLVLIDNYADGFERLSSGVVDAVAADTWVAAYTAEERHLSDVRLVGAPFATLPAAIALGTNQTALVEEMNGAIREITADGSLRAIVDRWRPREMMFTSRDRLSTLLQLGLGVLTATILCVSVAWAHVVRGQVGNRKRTEAALDQCRAERKRVADRLDILAHALHTTDDCIVISDADDRLLYVNAAFLETYDYTEDQVLGRHLSMLAAGISGRSIDALTKPTRGDGWSGELWTQTRTGHVLRASWATSIVRDAGGRMIAMVGVARDETGRRDLTKQLRQSQDIDAIGRLAAGVAHDFNNLLTIIMTTCEDAALVPGVPDLARDRIDDVVEAARTAASLTRQLLSLGRREMPQPQTLNLNDVLADAHRVLAGLVEPDVQLEVRQAPGLADVVVNPVQLQQVIINLAINGRDAMPAGGRLVIETRAITIGAENIGNHPPMPPGNYVSLSVCDGGSGMDAETQARIFEPFFTTKPAGRGTGLGLSTVRDIVTQSGGFLGVLSEPGAGSTFTVYLAAAPHGEPAARPEGERRGSGEVILVVDDALAVLELTRTYLTRIGYTVMVASTAAEAIALCAGMGSPPALVITDIVLPGTSGVSLAEQLRRQLPRLKVLYVSGVEERPPSEQVVLPGDSDFLTKPFVLHELAAKVHGLLNHR